MSLPNRASDLTRLMTLGYTPTMYVGAWQTVFHFHVHVVPRYDGDPLQLPWVPAPGDPGEISAAAQELAAK